MNGSLLLLVPTQHLKSRIHLKIFTFPGSVAWVELCSILQPIPHFPLSFLLNPRGFIEEGS